MKVRSWILSGQLAPGEQLVEGPIAELCGVSRTPVRDALRRLEAELLVERSDTQRTFVAHWSMEDVADAFELRAFLEGRAARLAAEKITPENLAELKIANDMVGASSHSENIDVSTFLEGNKQFHHILLTSANSRRLTALLNTLIEQPVIWRTAHFYDRAALISSHHEHNELIAAFERRDGAWAEAIMRAHILRAYHAYADAHQKLTE